MTVFYSWITLDRKRAGDKFNEGEGRLANCFAENSDKLMSEEAIWKEQTSREPQLRYLPYGDTIRPRNWRSGKYQSVSENHARFRGQGPNKSPWADVLSVDGGARRYNTTPAIKDLESTRTLLRIRNVSEAKAEQKQTRIYIISSSSGHCGFERIRAGTSSREDVRK